jgi:hypothetical protein
MRAASDPCQFFFNIFEIFSSFELDAWDGPAMPCVNAANEKFFGSHRREIQQIIAVVRNPSRFRSDFSPIPSSNSGSGVPASQIQLVWMSDQTYAVYVVVDPDFGERLVSLPPGVPVWIVDTPVNKPVAQRLWRERPQVNPLTGITTYNFSGDASPEENLLKELDTIDLHHGSYSANPPYTRMEVFGARLSDKIKFALADYGFHEFSPTTGGFVATRQVRAAQT